MITLTGRGSHSTLVQKNRTDGQTSIQLHPINIMTSADRKKTPYNKAYEINDIILFFFLLLGCHDNL